MSTIHDEVRIAAPAAKVYEALTTQAGYRGWWNGVARVDEHDGGSATLVFQHGGKPMTMQYRIDERNPNRRVRWSCVAHDIGLWIGTTLDWRLAEAGGDTVVSFEHAGWTSPPPDAVPQGWRHFMTSLKAYVETGAGQPW